MVAFSVLKKISKMGVNVFPKLYRNHQKQHDRHFFSFFFQQMEVTKCEQSYLQAMRFVIIPRHQEKDPAVLCFGSFFTLLIFFFMFVCYLFGLHGGDRHAGVDSIWQVLPPSAIATNMICLWREKRRAPSSCFVQFGRHSSARCLI